MADSDGISERLRGILFIILSASSFAAVDGLSKALADTQSVGQIVWARYALALPVLILTTPRAHWRTLFKTTRPASQLSRGLMPLAVSGTMVLAVRYLPLAEATVILFSAPFLVVALSVPFLGERVHPASWVGVVVGFAAVLLVARPGFGEISKYTIFPLAAAVFFALFQLVTRRLAATGERAQTTLAWTLAVGTVAATPVALMTWAPVTPSAWLLMIALGVVFGLAQAFMVRAFAHAPAGVLAPFGYAQIIAATIFGMIVFGAIPDVWTLLGVAMIIAAGVYVARSQTS
ncbi:MAG: DMT family transporter [Bauldia sp.]|nr:MAG: DMT family transporter [Bauldia sp.]